MNVDTLQEHIGTPTKLVNHHRTFSEQHCDTYELVTNQSYERPEYTIIVLLVLRARSMRSSRFLRRGIEHTVPLRAV